MKTKYLYFFTIVTLFNTFSIKSQSNDAEAALYNIGFGAVFSAVGAIINKKPNQPLEKVIKKSMWQGALGGYITFESKRILREVQRQNKSGYIWPAKLVNSIGTSIKENSALNKDFWEIWHINIGFSRFEFNFKDKFSVNHKLMPVAFIFTTGALLSQNFELKKSVQTGEFIFSHQNNKYSIASASPGVIMYNRDFYNASNTNEIVSIAIHEIVHIYQSNDFSIFNTYLNKSMKNWSEKNKAIKWTNKYLYPEFHYLILRPAYLLESANINNYYDNFFEHEAGYYSGTLN